MQSHVGGGLRLAGRDMASIARSSLLILSSLSVSGCNDSGSLDSRAAHVFIEVLVTDSAGVAVPFSHATVTTDPAPAIGPLQDALSDPDRGLREGIIMPLGPNGTALQELGVYPDGEVSDVALTIQTPGCGHPNRFQLPGRSVGTAHPEDTLRFQITVPTPYPVAVTDSGQICAQGIDAFWGPQSFLLLLNIDSIVGGQLLFGRWIWGPRWTDSGELGTFQGATGAGFVVLDFTSNDFLNRCTGLRLTVELHPDGRWGESFVAGVSGPNGSCLVNAEMFTFGSGEVWPGAFP